MKKILPLLFLLLPAPAALAGEAGVFVSVRHIRAGEEIRPDALKQVEAVPGDQALEPVELAGMEAVRPIRAGEKITRLMLRPARAVRAGERIKVRAGGARVKVRAWFTALQGGARGEVIEARNPASGRTCRVRVEGPGEAAAIEEEK